MADWDQGLGLTGKGSEENKDTDSWEYGEGRVQLPIRLKGGGGMKAAR